MTITERNPDGTIKKKILSSEEARELGRRRHSKPIADTKGSLLQEAGYADEKEAPEHLRVLAEIAASGRSGAVPALRDFLKLTRPTAEAPGKEIAEPGDVCPICGQFIMTGMRITDDGIDELKGFLAWVREHSEPNPGFAEFLSGRRL